MSETTANAKSKTAPKALSAQLQALKEATLEIEKYVAKNGWDAPVRVFALVYARKALQEMPSLESELPADVQLEKINDDYTLFSVEQEDLPQADSLNELLAQIYWPESVDGVAVSVERMILPPTAEKDLPRDETAALTQLQNHPARQDVRMVAARMRNGASWGAIRMRNHDKDALVLSEENIVAELCNALAMTFENDPERFME